MDKPNLNSALRTNRFLRLWIEEVCFFHRNVQHASGSDCGLAFGVASAREALRTSSHIEVDFGSHGLHNVYLRGDALSRARELRIVFDEMFGADAHDDWLACVGVERGFVRRVDVERNLAGFVAELHRPVLAHDTAL